MNQGSETPKPSRKDRGLWRRLRKLLIYYVVLLITVSGGIAIGYISGEKQGYQQASRDVETPLCSADNVYLGTLPSATAKMLFGGDDYYSFLRRTPMATQSKRMRIASLESNAADFFSFEGFYGDLDPAIARFTPVHFEALPENLNQALSVLVETDSGIENHPFTVFFLAPAAEVVLNWDSFHDGFAELKDLYQLQGLVLERFEVSPSCYIARYIREEEVFTAFALHNLPSDKRDRAQCYWVSALAGYGVSGFRHLFENYPLKSKGGLFSADVAPLESLYRRRTDSLLFDEEFGLPLGARVCQDWY